MKYLFDINNNHYTMELSKGETKQLEYLDGRFAKVTATVVIEEPTTTRTGYGFLRVEFENGTVWDSKEATICRIVTKQERERSRVGARIAQLRREKGMSQLQLAEATGMKQPNIARIEAGRYSTSVDVLSRIAEALGKKIDLV